MLLTQTNRSIYIFYIFYIHRDGWVNNKWIKQEMNADDFVSFSEPLNLPLNIDIEKSSTSFFSSSDNLNNERLDDPIKSLKDHSCLCNYSDLVVIFAGQHPFVFAPSRKAICYTFTISFLREQCCCMYHFSASLRWPFWLFNHDFITRRITSSSSPLVTFGMLTMLVYERCDFVLKWIGKTGFRFTKKKLFT